MALVNITNCPNGFDSGFKSVDNKLVLHASEEALNQLSDSSRGYVYVFSKNTFLPRGRTQVISYEDAKPLQIVEVKKEDLPEYIKVKDDE